MKRFLSAVLISCLMIGSICMSVFAAAASSSASQAETEAKAVIADTDKVSTDDIALYSAACVVMDADTGQVLYYKNPTDRHYPASITKILTSLLLIENADLNDKITFTEDCWTGIDRWSDMNVAMEDGEQLTVEQALYCMLLVSANEVCNQAGIQVAGSVENFAAMMNEKAASLGCTGSHFVTTNGLHDDDHYVTAHDMALISRAAILNDTFRTVTGTTYYKITTDKRPEGFELYHKHRMLAADADHDDRCIGGKTGYTPQAHNTLVTYMKQDDVTLVCVVLDNSNGHIYSDTKTACNYCFDTYTRASIDELAASDEGKALNDAAGGAAAENTAASDGDNGNANNNEGTGAAGEVSEGGSGSSQGIQLQSGAEGNEQAGSGTSAGGSSDGSSSENRNIGVSGFLSTLRSAASGISSFISSPGEYMRMLRDRAVTSFIDHIPYSFLVLLAIFLVITLIIVWLRGVIHRSIHRRRYRKMRGKKTKKRSVKSSRHSR